MPASPFRQLGGNPRRFAAPDSKPRGVKTGLPKSLSYARIEQEVDAAIAQLPSDKQAQIPAGATLPEKIVELALVWLNYQFQCQRPEDGGRLRIGGSIVDVIIYVGGNIVCVRVQGDFWHSLPGRPQKDAMQAQRLRARHYRVADLLESDLYQAWVQGNIKTFVEQAVLNAA